MLELIGLHRMLCLRRHRTGSIDGHLHCHQFAEGASFDLCQKMLKQCEGLSLILLHWIFLGITTPLDPHPQVGQARKVLALRALADPARARAVLWP